MWPALKTNKNKNPPVPCVDALGEEASRWCRVCMKDKLYLVGVAADLTASRMNKGPAAGHSCEEI